MTTTGTAPSQWSRPRLILLFVALFSVVALAVGGAWIAWSWRSATPPEVEFTGADPDVVAAVGAARAAVLRSPRSGAAWGHLGMVLRAHDYGQEANVCFAEAERLEPRDPRWPYLHGLTLLLTDLDRGIDKVRRAVELSGPSRPAPRLRLAEALLARGRPDEAESEFRHVLDHEPDNPRALLGLGRLLVRRDDLAGSLPYLRAARDGPFTHKAATHLLAEVYGRSGEEGALHDLGDVAGLPDDPPWPDPFVEEVERLQVGLQVVLAQADELLQQGRGGDAVGLLQQAVERRPESDQAWLTLGRTLIRLSDYPAAQRTLRTAVRIAPGSVEGWFHLGVALYLGGDHRAAADCFRKATELKPDHALAHYNLGQCSKEIGDRAGAVEAFRAVLRIQPDHAAARKELNALPE
jgi:tetratricopeptide (TPR) repeat protein